MMEGVPQAVIAELERLRDEGGGIIDPEKVVEAAADEGSPLRGYFEWDQAAAAHAHRLEQARKLLRRVRITYTEPDEPTVIRVPAYVSPPAQRRSEDGGYRLASELVRQYASSDVLVEIAGTIETLTRKLRALGEVFDLADEVADLERTALSLQVRARRERRGADEPAVPAEAA
jgi:hypothetical protein